MASIFDGTLAEACTQPSDVLFIGPPIPRMVARVKALLAAGQEVRIFTARVAACGESSIVACDDQDFADNQRRMIEQWCLLQFGQVLKVTATKDFQMIECWDDRVKQVVTNTGETLEEILAEQRKGLEELAEMIRTPPGETV